MKTSAGRRLYDDLAKLGLAHAPNGFVGDGILAIEAEAAASPEERGGGADPEGTLLKILTVCSGEGDDPTDTALAFQMIRDFVQDALATPAAPSEPAPLDVERLAEAMQRSGSASTGHQMSEHGTLDDETFREWATEIAAEYARLQSTPTPTEEPTPAVVDGRLARTGWHYPACWQSWASAWHPSEWPCICANLDAPEQAPTEEPT